MKKKNTKIQKKFRPDEKTDQFIENPKKFKRLIDKNKMVFQLEREKVK